MKSEAVSWYFVYFLTYDNKESRITQNMKACTVSGICFGQDIF